MNQTEQELLKYTLPPIKDLIIEYAFKHKYKKELFELGYYEECTKIINDYIIMMMNNNIYQGVHCNMFSYAFNKIFFLICKGGHMKLIDFMINIGINSWHIGLLGACEGSQTEVIKIMFEKGIKKSHSILDYACKNGNIKTVKYVVKKAEEVKLDFTENDWEGCLYSARDSKNIELIKFVADKFGKFNLVDVCSTGNIELVRSYIKENGIDCNWTSMLTVSCNSGNLELVKFIIKKDKESNNELEPIDGLFYACDSGNTEMVKLIINEIGIQLHGEEPNEEENIKWNDCLKEACVNGHIEIYKVIIENGTLLGASFNNPYNISLAAVSNVDMVKFMVENGTNTLFYDAILQAYKYVNIEAIDFLNNYRN